MAKKATRSGPKTAKQATRPAQGTRPGRRPSRGARGRAAAGRSRASRARKEPAPAAEAATLEDGGAFSDTDRVGCVVCAQEIWDIETGFWDPYHPLHPCEHVVLYWTTHSDMPAFCEESLLAKARQTIRSDADLDDDPEDGSELDENLQALWIFHHGFEIADLAAEHYGKPVKLYTIVGHQDSYVLMLGSELEELDDEEG